MKGVCVARAHRISWALNVGPVPMGLYVLHKCDNPSCVRPFHLFLGTLSDNSRDAYNKGRVKVPGVFGEDHWNAKLKNEDLPKIIKLLESGLSYSKIASMFGVSRRAISHIKNGACWGKSIKLMAVNP